ncbi:MAG: DUF11 domain-containing protein [Anaerolineales bacterium]|nr:DUF11 domain-containing protein [Anaerolineales bacterium]
MLIVAVVITALGTSLAGLAGLAQAAPTSDPALVVPAAAPANLPLLDAGPFTVTKSSANEGDTTLRPGERLTYTITIFNNGDLAATNVTISDTLPANTTFVPNSVDVLPLSPDWSVGTGSILVQGLTVTAQSLVTVTYAVTVNSNVAHNTQIINTASVTSTELPDPASATAADTVVIEADLSLSKSAAPATVVAGETLTYTLTITNNGPSPAANVVVSDTLPLSLSLQSVTPATSTQSGQQLNWNLDSIAVGATQTITIVAKVGGDVRNPIQNTATVTSTVFDPTPGNNSDAETTAVNALIDLTLTKTDQNDQVTTGALVVYNLVITNNGPSDATGVVLTDTLPQSMNFQSSTPSFPTCIESGGTVTCNLGAITRGSSKSVVIRAFTTQAGVITNTASVSGNESDLNPDNNTDTENTTVQPVDLSVTKSDFPNDPVFVGYPLSYTLTIMNNGPNQATGIVLTDTLPSEVLFKSAIPSGAGCNHSGGIVTCSNLGNLPHLQSIVVTIVVTPTLAGTIVNTASVRSSEPDPVSANNTDSESTTVNPVADLLITKTDFPDPVTAGTSLTYTLTITNNGPSPATGVVVTDTLPASVTFVSAPGCTPQPNNQVRCTYANIASGSTASPAVISVTVNPAAPNLITNTATVAGVEFDPNTNNNSATIPTTVNRLVNLSIAKTSSPTLVAAGNSLTYTLTVANSGPSEASGVIVTDTLPAGVTFAAASAGCSNASNIVTCSNLGNVSSGGAITASIRVTVASSILGTLTNTATVTSNQPDSNTTNNTVTATTTVTRVTDLAITQSSTPNPVTAGNNITFNLMVINNGPSDAANVIVNDTLPAGVTFQSVTPPNPTCSHAGGIVTCNLGGMVKGNTRSIAIVAKVNDTTAGNVINTAQVTVSGSSDPVPENNSTSAPAFVGGLSKVFLPFVLKPAPTTLFIENDTGGPVTFSVLEAGVSCNVPVGDQNFFCGAFPPGGYTVKVVSICGTLTAPKFYDSGPQSTRVFCK